MQKLKDMIRVSREEFISNVDHYLNIVDDEHGIVITENGIDDKVIIPYSYVDFQDDDLGQILIAALRYSYGKLNYLPEYMTSFVINNIELIDDKTLKTIYRDINEYGMPAADWNSDKWHKILKEIELEFSKRSITIND